MPTILSHPVVPLALALGLGRGAISRRLLAAGVAVSVLPDLDVVAFRLGIGYAEQWGHRGFSHSLLFALIVALGGSVLYRWLRSTPLRAFGFLLLATMSHGALDALTNGGLGVAFLWPWSEGRHFAPIQPIQVSPLGLSRFLTDRGLAVLWSELLWVWLPCFALALPVWFARRRFRPTSTCSTT